MHRRIIRFILQHKKFVSRSSGLDQHKMNLFGENLQYPKSPIARYDDINTDLLQSAGLRNVQNGYSKISFMFKSNIIVFYIDAFGKAVPGVEEKPDEDQIPTIEFNDLVKLMVKTKDSDGKDTVNSGGRLGRLDATNEAGFFHRTDRSRLKELKKKLKDKPKDPTEPKKTG